jgi:tetratricopeptide (TPR) repeat protein
MTKMKGCFQYGRPMTPGCGGLQPACCMQPESDPRFCDGCGQINREAARFCASCGTDLPDQARAAALTPVDLARRAWDRGDPPRARAILASALAEQPDDHQARLMYAVLLLRVADWTGGLEHLERLRATAPWSPVVEAYIGGALLGLNRVMDAKETLDAAVARAPDDFYVLFKRGEVYCRLGIFLIAVEALERASRITVEDPGGREAVARLLKFARDKSAGGFVRTARARRAGFAFKWRWRPAAKHGSAARADQVWGT